MTVSSKLELSEMNIFVAHTKEKRIIGSEGTMPWQKMIKGDLGFFKKATTSQKNIALVMGRITFESIGKPLPNRENVVISKTMKEREGVIVKRSFEEAIEFCKKNKYIIVISGGEAVYKEALKHKCKLFITIIDDGNMTGDRFFAKHDTKLECVNEEVYPLIKEIKGVKYDGKEFSENENVYSFFVGTD